MPWFDISRVNRCMPIPKAKLLAMLQVVNEIQREHWFDFQPSSRRRGSMIYAQGADYVSIDLQSCQGYSIDTPCTGPNLYSVSLCMHTNTSETCLIWPRNHHSGPSPTMSIAQ
jgi:hypothetical protein